MAANKRGDVGEKNPGSLEGENDSQIESSTKINQDPIYCTLTQT